MEQYHHTSAVTLYLCLFLGFVWGHYSWTWRHTLYWVNMEDFVPLLHHLEVHMLQPVRHSNWSLYCHGLGMWLCCHHLLSSLVHHPNPPCILHCVYAHAEDRLAYGIMLYCTVLWRMWNNLKQYQNSKSLTTSFNVILFKKKSHRASYESQVIYCVALSVMNSMCCVPMLWPNLLNKERSFLTDTAI